MVPGCSVLTITSCQGTRLPTVSTERWTARVSARATVMGSGVMALAGPFGGAAFWASDRPHETESTRRSESRSESRRDVPPWRTIGVQSTAGGRARASSRPAPEAVVRYRSMAVQRTPMTRPGHERLKAELDRLKRIEGPHITRAIAEARAHGDLSENAEYHAAREKQGMTEARIKD